MQADPLQQLRDVHLPADPSWWPPAPGWWVLTAMVLGLAGWAIYALIRRYRSRAPIRLAQQALQDLNHRAPDQTDVAYASAINEILKRLLVHGLKRYDYAPLSGQEWLQALDIESGTNSFSNGAGQILGNARFAPATKVDPDALNACVDTLISNLQVSPKTQTSTNNGENLTQEAL